MKHNVLRIASCARGRSWVLFLVRRLRSKTGSTASENSFWLLPVSCRADQIEGFEETLGESMGIFTSVIVVFRLQFRHSCGATCADRTFELVGNWASLRAPGFTQLRS